MHKLGESIDRRREGAPRSAAVTVRVAQPRGLAQRHVEIFSLQPCERCLAQLTRSLRCPA